MSEPEISQRFLRVEAIFNEALEQPASQRDAWLREACGDDAALLEETGKLLRAHEREQQMTQSILASRTAGAFAKFRLGPYEVVSLLGRGGMGAVYLAQRADGQYQKQVAIKLIDLPLATEVFTERFRQERQILAGLDHPRIARLLDGGVASDGVLYIVMEYIDGESIDAYCRRHSLSLEEKLEVFCKICEAVQFAHQNLVVHRDLKPDNILVSADGEPHLLDFGTAKLLSADSTADVQGLTRQGFLSFTPAYASPEQVLGKPITTASDTYSLGVLLYLLLTEKMPYELSEYTTEEMVSVICETAPHPPSDSAGTFPNADLEAILAKALRKEPERRYQTAALLAADIEAYRQHRPVLAHKGTFRYTASKFLRRNKLAVAFVSALLLTLTVGLVAVMWQAHVARQAERRAEARSSDLLQLSDSLLTELDSAIQQLPGSTGVQQMLVGRVLEHLQRLSVDARADKATGVSLAGAYVRLAALQGDPYEQNMGDTAGALKSLDRATGLLAPLASASPGDAAVTTGQARVEEMRGEILSLNDDSPGAVASFNAAIAHFESVLALPHPPAKLCFETAVAHELLGDVMGQDTGFSDLTAAMFHYQKAMDLDARALEIDPDFGSVRRGLILMQLKIGRVHLETDPALALVDFEKAFERFNALLPVEKSKLANVRTRGLLLRKQGLAFAELGRYREAQPAFAQATEAYESLHQADPKDMRAKRDMELLLENEAQSAEFAASPGLQEPGYDPRLARIYAGDLLTRKLTSLYESLQAKPRDSDLQFEIASTEIRLAAAQGKLDHKQEQPPKVKDALETLKRAAVDPKASPLTLQLAFDAFQDVDGTSLRDPSFLLTCASRGNELTHHKSPDWLLMLAAALRANANLKEAHLAAQQGLALLPPMTAANQNFRLRRLLLSY